MAWDFRLKVDRLSQFLPLMLETQGAIISFLLRVLHRPVVHHFRDRIRHVTVVGVATAPSGWSRWLGAHGAAEPSIPDKPLKAPYD